MTRQSSTPISQYVAWGNPDEAALFENQVYEVNEAFADVLAMDSVRQAQRELILQAQAEWEQAVAVGRATFAIPAVEKNDLQQAENMFVNFVTATINTLYEAHNIRIEDTRRNQDEATGRQRTTLIITATSFAGGLVFFFFAIYVLAQHILKPLRRLSKGIQQYSAGDLSHRIDLHIENEIGELARGINTMAERLENDQIALAQLAIRDSLTNLYNRREFERLLAEEMHRSTRYHHPLSLLLIDIDKFKQINDGLGHRAGDQALRLISASIREISRKGDIVARYGGDELAVLLPETPLDDALTLAERIRKLVSHQRLETDDGSKTELTLSIGVATTSGQINRGEQLIDAADQAMYIAKAEGRNRVRYSSEAQGEAPQGRLPMTMP
jgi:diguanylate cyclase (GGDEF)-like protein